VVGKVLGDVYDMSIGNPRWTAGGVAFGLTLVVVVVALTVDGPYRWSRMFLIGYSAGFGIPDSGGLRLFAASIVPSIGSTKPLRRLTHHSRRTNLAAAHNRHYVNSVQIVR
jgi:hypothetical protein